MHRIARSKLADRQYFGQLGERGAVACTTEPSEGAAHTTDASEAVKAGRFVIPPFDYLALGPLSNLSDALSKGELTSHDIRRIVFSGGAFEAPGNVGALAEFNVFADPRAASSVFNSGIRDIIVVPLDVTSRATYGIAEFSAISRSGSHFGKLLTAVKHEDFGRDAGYREPMWDLVAAVVYLRPEVIRRADNAFVTVEQEPSPWFGATFTSTALHETQSEASVTIVKEIDAHLLGQLFVRAFGQESLT